MTQEIITHKGFSAHIDICLIGAGLNTFHFRYALEAATMARLRRNIATLELKPDGRQTRIGKLKTRLAQLEKMNAQMAEVFA